MGRMKDFRARVILAALLFLVTWTRLYPGRDLELDDASTRFSVRSARGWHL